MALSQKGAQYQDRDRIEDGPVKRALDFVMSSVIAVANQVNATPAGVTPAPFPISALSVTSADGFFDAQIQDGNPVNRGIQYFLEYSLNPVGPWTVISLGPSRNWRGGLGNQTLYWKAYSQYPTSDPSQAVYFGGATNPTPVVGGGTATGPTPQPSTGSGTAPGSGLLGGSGFGRTQRRDSPQR